MMRGQSTGSSAAVLTVAAWLVFAGLFLGAPVPARAGGSVTLPDLVMMVPTDAISIGTDPSTGDRQLQFTHITADVGTGPFEIDPAYDSTTGMSTFTQEIYNSPSPGVWNPDHSVPVGATGRWHPPTDYAFPLTAFTLNEVAADGSVGAVVATSPKTDYCITGDFRLTGVPNTPNSTFISPSNCNDPTKALGWSVGWGDQYDQTDAGQPIDLTRVPDGTYVLHATVDPLHVLTESDTNNDVTDTKLEISGSRVTVLSQTHPVTTPPAVSMTAPAPGTQVSGQVTLRASASATAPASVTSVQFLLDGQPLGVAVTTAPYSYAWTAGSTSLGNHLLSARARDSDGNVSTATPVAVSVIQGPSSGGGAGGGSGTTGGGKSYLKVRVLRWRRGVLTLVVTNLPKHARLSVELGFAGRRRPRFLTAVAGRLQVHTSRPRELVLRVFVASRRVGKPVTLRLVKRPSVRIVNPVTNDTLSGTVPIVAETADATALGSVRFWIDGSPIGRPVTHAPYVIHWRSTGVRAGRHRITAVATDGVGNSTSSTVSVTVANPRPPMTCFVLQARIGAHGRGVATTAVLRTAVPGETLVALVAAVGPSGRSRQSAEVSGAGLRWKLIERANASSGDSEIWAARAPTILTGERITAALHDSRFDASLTVIAMEGVSGTGSSAGASGSMGPPHLELTTSAPTSLVVAVGNDASRAVPRVLPFGWVPLGQRLDRRAASTLWSQYTNQPTGRRASVLSVGVSSPTADPWNLAAVELVNSGD